MLVRRFALVIALVTLAGFVALAAPAGPPAQHGRNVVVPCPNAVVDSTNAITGALLSVASGGTVLLEPCTYYLARAVDIETPFHGTLKGAGMERTIITTLPADAPGYVGSFDVPTQNWITDLDHPGTRGPTIGPMLFRFLAPAGSSSDVSMSDLTIRVTDPTPAVNSVRADWFVGMLLAFVTVEGDRADSRFERVAFEGAENPAAGMSNAYYAIQIWGELSFWPNPGTLRPMVGEHSLLFCRFEGINVAHNPGYLKDSRVTVHKNFFSYAGYWPTDIAAGGLEDTRLEITENVFEVLGTTPLGEAVYLFYGGERPDHGPIVMISGNTIRGNGDYGIQLFEGAQGLVLNNDLRGFEAAVSQIFFGELTSNLMVVGAEPGSVQDLGKNNTIKYREPRRQ